MANVFNILINHKGDLYTALLSFKGNQDVEPVVKVNHHEEKIEIRLPNGRLIFSIPEIIKQLKRAKDHSEEGKLFITENISLQLLNVTT